LEAGAAEPRTDWVSVEEVLAAAIDDLTPAAPAREALAPEIAAMLDEGGAQAVPASPAPTSTADGAGDFQVSIDRDLPLVRADSTQLERAFVNVLENARRHSGGHPVSVRARAVRTVGGTDGRLIVRVVDRGPGVPPAQLERVFEPFYKAGTARGGRRGSGLGLAIARGFTEANGGTLHVESLPGQGATFVFELPLEGA
jgi:two-component system, OmpR family, sensor histidine kinase KdpD